MMGRHEHSAIHTRLNGLAGLVGKMLGDADAPGKIMSKREREDLRHILSVMNTILAEEDRDQEMPCRNSRQYLNTQCDFFDLDANRIQCAIGCDMFHCSKRCAYATNVSGSLPPYCTKYMKASCIL